jgi:hypothetical protein
MEKNATWSPSDTMIARELKQLGRGIENYRAAMAKAEAEGLDAAERIDSVEMPPPTARGSLKRPRAQPDTSKATDIDSDDEPIMSSRGREAGNVQSELPDFSSFESQDISNSKLQLPYPGDYTSSTNTFGIGFLDHSGPVDPKLYTPTSAAKIQEKMQKM